MKRLTVKVYTGAWTISPNKVVTLEAAKQATDSTLHKYDTELRKQKYCKFNIRNRYLQ